MQITYLLELVVTLLFLWSTTRSCIPTIHIHNSPTVTVKLSDEQERSAHGTQGKNAALSFLKMKHAIFSKIGKPF